MKLTRAQFLGTMGAAIVGHRSVRYAVVPIPKRYSLSIGGVDRTAELAVPSVTFADILNDIASRKQMSWYIDGSDLRFVPHP